MRKFTFVRTLTIATIAGIAGCETGPEGGVSDSMHRSESRYIGNWRTSTGDLLMVKDASGDAFTIEHAAPGGNKRYKAYAVDVGGKSMWEVTLFRPEKESGVPVYNYYLVEGSGDAISATAIRSEWLEKTVKEMNAGSYKSTGDLLPGTGGAIVKDRAAMEAMLERAVKDPSAFGQPETLTRVKSK